MLVLHGASCQTLSAEDVKILLVATKKAEAYDSLAIHCKSNITKLNELVGAQDNLLNTQALQVGNLLDQKTILKNQQEINKETIRIQAKSIKLYRAGFVGAGIVGLMLVLFK